jgi:hypothetical protein
MYPDIIFHENPSNGSCAVPRGKIDSHDEANSHFSQFFQLLKIKIYISTSSLGQENNDGWPWLEAAMSIFNVRFLSKSSPFCKK